MHPEYSRILIRAANWVGDAVMSLAALRAVRERFPRAEIAVLARPWVADLYARESFADRVIPHTAPRGLLGLAGHARLARRLRRERFDCAILFQNAFEAALIARLAGIPRRIGYDRDARGFLLTDPIAVPRRGEIPRHECFYYLELLRRAGLLASLPRTVTIQLEGAAVARAAGAARMAREGAAGPVIGVSPGAAHGGAKRWLPERFAEAAASLASASGSSVALFGSDAEQPLCEQVARILHSRGTPVRNWAGRTTLAEFIELAAACQVFLTNDSGAMHIASALGVPTVAVFGATDHEATAPAGPLARIVREPVECSPCLLRECPIDHRCMTRVTARQVAEEAGRLAGLGVGS